MTKREEALDWVLSLLESQLVGVLATEGGGTPYASLVAFAFTPDMRKLMFVTPISSRKFRNVGENSRVALLVDDRRNLPSDLKNAAAVTAVGSAKLAEKEEEERMLRILMDRHPCLNEFAQFSSSALIVVDVEAYILVSRFQDVVELRMQG